VPGLIADFLLMQPIDANAKEMPSPTALKHKIILKVLLHPGVFQKIYKRRRKIQEGCSRLDICIVAFTCT